MGGRIGRWMREIKHTQKIQKKEETARLIIKTKKSDTAFKKTFKKVRETDNENSI